MNSIIARAKAIVERRGLSLTRVYGLTGVSPTTLKFCFMTGQEPKRPATLEALRKFVEMNEDAGSNAELRCV